jgi:hypothetical protein
VREKKERDREQINSKTNTQRDKNTKKTVRQTYKTRERQTETKRKTDRHKEKERQTDTLKKTDSNEMTESLTVRQIDRTEILKDRETHRNTDAQTQNTYVFHFQLDR